MRTCPRARGLLLPLFLLGGMTSEAAASPWTLPDGELVVSVGTDVQYARREFLVDGTYQPFPLNGEYLAINLRPGLRFGVTDRTEIGLQAVLTYASYQADEAYFGPEPTDELTLPEVRDGILSFDRSTTGLGDIHAFIRHRLTGRGRVVFALELDLKFPTGYRPLTDAFNGDVEPTEDGPVDDVTLGDGQFDATGQALLGWAPPGGWFLRLDAGIRARFFGPGQQVVGAFKIGRWIARVWVPYLLVDGEHSFTQGEVVGQTLNTSQPETPAREFEFSLVETRDLRLDRSMVRVGTGSIFRLGDRELDLSYTVTVWGQNVAQTHTLALGVPFTL